MDDIRNPKHPDHYETLVDLWDGRDKTEQMYSKRVDKPINMIEIPKDLFHRMLAVLETLTEIDELIEDAKQWIPPATDEEIERSFDSYR